MHIVYTCLNCGSTAFIQKQPHGGAAEEEIEQEKRYADQNTEELSLIHISTPAAM